MDAQNAGNDISGIQISKIFGGSTPPDPPPFMRGILATHVAFSHCYPPLIYYLTERSLFKKCPPTGKSLKKALHVLSLETPFAILPLGKSENDPIDDSTEAQRRQHKITFVFCILCFIFCIFVFYILYFCVLYFVFLCFIFCIFVFYILYFCVLYFVFYILYFIFCILYFVFYILYFIFCILYFVFCILYFVFYILYFIFCILYFVFYILYFVFLCNYNVLRRGIIGI